jgi:NADH pyrophosphatase NudC (nudix superfamily)
MGHYVEAGRVCPNCGLEYGSNYKFCIECGAKLPPPETETVKVPQCENSPDHKVDGANKFCGECGGRVIEVEVERPKTILVFGPDPKVIG